MARLLLAVGCGHVTALVLACGFGAKPNPHGHQSRGPSQAANSNSRSSATA